MLMYRNTEGYMARESLVTPALWRQISDWWRRNAM